MKKVINGLKVILFVLIGMFLYGKLESVFVPKYHTEKFEQFDSLQEDSLDVVFVGTSHAECGYLPMEAFEKYGITSYILATLGQPIEMSYLMTEYLFESQDPKLLVLDASNLFFQHSDQIGTWDVVLNRIPLSKEKYEMAQVYHELYPEKPVLGVMFPLIKYRTRWDELGKRDFFTDLSSYPSMGENITEAGAIVSGGIDVDTMNNMTNRANNIYHTAGTYDGVYKEEEVTEYHEYQAEISDYNLDYLKRIKELCDQNNTELLVVKIPAVYDPEIYPSAWTAIRSQITSDRCNELGIPFFDVLYGAEDFYLDTSSDFIDGGCHTNIRGALKVTDCLAQYFVSHYNLEGHTNTQFYEKLDLYHEKREEALLKTENDFMSYMQRVMRFKEAGKTIMIASNSGTLSGMSEEYRNTLSELGVCFDYGKYERGGCTAYIRNGEVCAQEISDYTSKLELETKGSKCVLSATEEEFSQSISLDTGNSESGKQLFYGPSLLIVVYDEDNSKVIDVAHFAMNNEFQTIERNRNNG